MGARLHAPQTWLVIATSLPRETNQHVLGFPGGWYGQVLWTLLCHSLIASGHLLVALSLTTPTLTVCGFTGPPTGRTLQTWTQSCNQDGPVRSKGYLGSITFQDMMSDAGDTTPCLLKTTSSFCLSDHWSQTVETDWERRFGRNRPETRAAFAQEPAAPAGPEGLVVTQLLFGKEI